jgi:hypothetical protein
MFGMINSRPQSLMYALAKPCSHAQDDADPGNNFANPAPRLVCVEV